MFRNETTGHLSYTAVIKWNHSIVYARFNLGTLHICKILYCTDRNFVEDIENAFDELYVKYFYAVWICPNVLHVTLKATYLIFECRHTYGMGA